MKVRISRAFKGSKHIGWKKTVGGRVWFLGYGTSPADEAKAMALATALEAKWQILKLGGGTELTQTDFDDAKDLVACRPRWSSAQSIDDLVPVPGPLATSGTLGALPAPPPRPQVPLDRAGGTPVPEARPDASPHRSNPQPRHWLYEAMDEVIAHVRLTLKPDASNGDHVFNTIDRIGRTPRRSTETCVAHGTLLGQRSTPRTS